MGWNRVWPRFARVSSGASSPQGKRRFVPVAGSQEAAFSHSASVGRRRPAQRAHAWASWKHTCCTGSESGSTSTRAKRRRNHCAPSRNQKAGARLPLSHRQRHPARDQSRWSS